MPMKMARASEQDLEVAQQTASFIESLQKEWVPEAMESDNDVFDIEDSEQCQQVLRKLLEINNRGSIFRVTFGMLVLLDPANKLIDPDADTLEAHPDVTRLQAENAALQQRLNVADQRVDDLQSERDALKAEAGRLTDDLSTRTADLLECGTKRKRVQSELTKARELLRSNATDFEGIRRALASFHKDNQEQWCGYLDDSLGICLYRIKELAAFLAHQSAPAAKCDHARKHHEHGGTQLRCSDCGEACAPAAKGESDG